MKKFIGDNGGGTPNLGESKDNVFFKNEEKAKLQVNERKKYFQRADKTVFSDGGEELTSREYEEDKAFKESDESMSSRESGLPSSSAQSEEMPIHCLTVIGQVEGHFLLSDQTKTTKYEHVLPALVAIEESPKIKGLLILLNTVGGDVEAGLAIAEMIAGMDTPTVSLVLGGGHSIGVPLAVSADYSFIAPSATMTIHPVRMNGLVVGVPQTFSYFDKMQDRIVNFVTSNSRISKEDFKRLMMNTGGIVTDIGSLLSGEEAVKEGIINEVGGLRDAMRKLNELIKEKEKKCFYIQ